MKKLRQLKIQKIFTNRNTMSLDKYLNEISRIPTISAEEEVELARRIREGDPKALEKLVNANLRFVVSVAKQYQNQGVMLGDLLNEGNLGLIKAAKRFDETRGFKFISYAVWWIRQSILAFLSEQTRIVRLPLNKVGEIGRISAVAAKLEQEHEREPTAEEIAAAMEVPLIEVEDALRSAGRHLSIDAPLTEGEENNLLGVLDNNDEPPPDFMLIQHESLQTDLEIALSKLPEKERDALKYYYGLGGTIPLSFERIGKITGLTTEGARQTINRALYKLKKGKKNNHLRAYL